MENSSLSPIVLFGKGAIRFGGSVLQAYDRAGLGAVLLLANEWSNPDMLRGAMRATGKLALLVAIPDSPRSFFLRNAALAEARVAVFSDSGVAGFITAHARPSVVGSVISLDDARPQVPAVFRRLRPPIIAGVTI